MQIFIIFVFLLIIAGIVYFFLKMRSEKSEEEDYLPKFAHFFEGEIIDIPHSHNSRRINFKYRGYDCAYEEVHLPGLSADSLTKVGYLKLKSKSDLTLTFSEKVRTQIRSNVKTLEEVTTSSWGRNEVKVELPRSLAEFQVYSNKPQMATHFINTSKVQRIFETYKNRDSRGFSLMGLQLVEGVLSLEFFQGGLRPAILELQHNVTAAESYLQELMSVAEVLQELKAKEIN